MSAHYCSAAGCSTIVRTIDPMCPDHWGAVPSGLRRAFQREVDGSSRQRVLSNEAVALIADKEGKAAIAQAMRKDRDMWIRYCLRMGYGDPIEDAEGLC